MKTIFNRVSILCTLFLVIAVSILASGCSSKTSFSLNVNNEDCGKLITYTVADTTYFIFTSQQYKLINNFYGENKNASLKLSFTDIVCADSAGSTLYFGYLYDDDMSSERKVNKNISQRPLSGIDFTESGYNTVDVAMCFTNEKQLPKGFFVKSHVKYNISKSNIENAAIGFDLSSDKPYFAFASNGGTAKKDMSLFDFTASPFVFDLYGRSYSKYPVFNIAFTYSCYVTAGGERLHLYKSENDLSSYSIPSQSLKSPFAQWSFSDNEGNIKKLLCTLSEKNDVYYSDIDNSCVVNPIVCDPGLIMKWKKSFWRGKNYELFQWDAFDGILYFDTENYAYQDNMFKRLAFFVEKNGYKGKLLSNEFLADKHGYNAHDYSASSLASFFNTALNQNFSLNKEELVLKEILIKNKVLIDDGEGNVSEGKGAVISISQESPDYLRVTFVAHEGWHGLFFTDEDFRNTVAAIYYTMDQTTLAYLKKYFSITPSLNYDISDDYLMKNEFMAYMLQRPLDSVRQYYINMASRSHSQMWAKQLADYVILTEADGFYSAASMLDEYVETHWGYNAGRIWHISR